MSAALRISSPTTSSERSTGSAGSAQTFQPAWEAIYQEPALARNAGILGGGEPMPSNEAARAASALVALALLTGGTILVAAPVRGVTPVRLSQEDFWEYTLARTIPTHFGISLTLSGTIRYEVLGGADVQAGTQPYDVDRVDVAGNGTVVATGTVGLVEISISSNWSQRGELWLNRSDLGTVHEINSMSFEIADEGRSLVGFNDTSDFWYEPPAGGTYRPDPLVEGATWSRYTERVYNETDYRMAMWWNSTVGAETPLTVHGEAYSVFPVTIRSSDYPLSYQIHYIDPNVGMPVKVVSSENGSTIDTTLELIDHRYAQRRDEVLFTLAMTLAIVAAVGVIAAVTAAVLLRSRRVRPPVGPPPVPPGPTPPSPGPPGAGPP